MASLLHQFPVTFAGQPDAHRLAVHGCVNFFDCLIAGYNSGGFCVDIEPAGWPEKAMVDELKSFGYRLSIWQMGSTFLFVPEGMVQS